MVTKYFRFQCHLVFFQVTMELPLSLTFLHTSSVPIPSNAFCIFWIIFNYTLFVSELWTMAVACIERYWLVFYRAFFARHLILLHYLPIALCVIYPLTLYSLLVTTYPCTNSFDYTQDICGGACYLYEVGHQILRNVRDKINKAICFSNSFSNKEKHKRIARIKLCTQFWHVDSFYTFFIVFFSNKLIPVSDQPLARMLITMHFFK